MGSRGQAETRARARGMFPNHVTHKSLISHLRPRALTNRKSGTHVCTRQPAHRLGELGKDHTWPGAAGQLTWQGGVGDQGSMDMMSGGSLSTRPQGSREEGLGPQKAGWSCLGSGPGPVLVSWGKSDAASGTGLWAPNWDGLPLWKDEGSRRPRLREGWALGGSMPPFHGAVLPVTEGPLGRRWPWSPAGSGAPGGRDRVQTLSEEPQWQWCVPAGQVQGAA